MLINDEHQVPPEPVPADDPVPEKLPAPGDDPVPDHNPVARLARRKDVDAARE
ncbi:hypothetical protein [Noviherbaspirillum sp. ST9]|uniref:hypothetical protein n=1 Tax=Noviherbaspirillum sp. ST9 TaxID=3401606 RepID=UPI003B5885A7